MLSIRFILGFLLLSVLFAGCLLPGLTVNVDAIAVWQHKGESSWDIYYSIWDHNGKVWFTPAGSASAPIAVDAGDDHDPDVSSNDQKAIAVWAKSGSGIYYSIWENLQWTDPASLTQGRTDSDPTVAVDPSGNAVALWVTNKNSLSFSYYKNNMGWTNAEKISTDLVQVSLPELTYNTKDGIYYLVFTGTDASGNNNAYGTSYSGGAWSSPVTLGSDALLDNNMPTDQRTGASAAENKQEVTVVWPGSAHVYSAVFGGSQKTVDTGEMSDTAYDSNDVANGAYTKREDLYHMPNVKVSVHIALNLYLHRL